MIKWTIPSARLLVRSLLERLAPLYYVGLTGSVLRNGFSGNDLDLIVYPSSSVRQDKDFVVQALVDAGLKRRSSREFVKAIWQRKGSDDEKHVEVWEYEGKKVDIFFLS